MQLTLKTGALLTVSDDFSLALTGRKLLSTASCPDPPFHVHVFSILFYAVSLQGHNIFANLCSKEYSNMMQLLKQAILSTDLTLHFE